MDAGLDAACKNVLKQRAPFFDATGTTVAFFRLRHQKVATPLDLLRVWWHRSVVKKERLGGRLVNFSISINSHVRRAPERSFCSSHSQDGSHAARRTHTLAAALLQQRPRAPGAVAGRRNCRLLLPATFTGRQPLAARAARRGAARRVRQRVDARLGRRPHNALARQLPPPRREQRLSQLSLRVAAPDRRAARRAGARAAERRGAFFCFVCCFYEHCC